MARALGLILTVLFGFGAIEGCSCDSTSGAGRDGSADGSSDLSAATDGSSDLSATVDGSLDSGAPDGSGSDGIACGSAGANCATGGDCCSQMCDPQNHICVAIRCGAAGASCNSAADCCGLACIGSHCSAMACTSDGQACASSASCCSTQCGASGTCTPLNPMCKTAGNQCTQNPDCCNQNCINGRCASPSQVSYCVQVGDICQRDSDCCTAVCNVATGATAGTCAAIATSCQIDGTLCSGCGVCCSHFCGPFGAGGPSICQPASGCHVQGDTCTKNSDCCGGDPSSMLPGAGLIVCVPDPTYPTKIGTCGTPMASNCPPNTPTCKNSCDPEGNVCHYLMTAVCQGGITGVRNDCCACISGKACCQPDSAGIPRCNALAACVQPGGSCAFSGDCCNGLPCVPDSAGLLHCGAMCVPSGGLCTTNADCCTGLACVAQPGSLKGTCTPPVPPPPPPVDMAGIDLAGAPDLAGSDLAAPICAQYGQACSATVACCNGVTCRTPFTSGATLCGPTNTNCTCFNLIQ